MNKYIKVVVDVPVARVDKMFDYQLPTDLVNQTKVGQAVKVPFGRRQVTGFIVAIGETPAIEASKIKKIKNIMQAEPFFDKKMLSLYKWIASFYHSYLIQVIKAAIPYGAVRGKVNKKTIQCITLAQSEEATKQIIKELSNRAYKQQAVLKYLLANNETDLTITELAKRVETTSGTVYRLIEKKYLKYYNKDERRKPSFHGKSAKNSFKLTKFQENAVANINQNLANNKFGVFLLHGVTGSGKTEVYIRLLEKNLQKKQGAILLVPEIALTPVMVGKLLARFNDEIAVLHSNLSSGERYDEWCRLKDGKASIAVGARSAIFAPVKDLGLIIIDEEHENTYKQTEYPPYHARQVAVKRASEEDAVVVLGSATPTIESSYLARKDKFKLLELPERIYQAEMPPVLVVDMREELKEGNFSIFSNKLKSEIEKTLARNKQVLLFLNRRGFASFYLCRSCGHVIECNHCDISLTYHTNPDRLVCHYCGYQVNTPHKCPVCASKYIKPFGLGTQRITDEIEASFPEANVVRMDADTTTRKGSHQKILNRLADGGIDILIGTQMVAKGHDFPAIELVGVIAADTSLSLPDFRSSERTFQLLTQVAGRTGRGDKQGKVIVQTYQPDHFSIQAAAEHDYNSFYEKELSIRKDLNYPPFSRLVNLTVQGLAENQVEKVADQLAVFLHNYKNHYQELLGPVPAPLAKVRNKFRWQIVLKFENGAKREYVIQKLEENFLPVSYQQVELRIDVDPWQML